VGGFSELETGACLGEPDKIRGLNTTKTDTMIKNQYDTKQDRERRLLLKNQDHQYTNEIVNGTGISPWEAKEVVKVAHEIYFTTPGTAPWRSGQLRYDCVRADQGAGKPIRDCAMVSVMLHLLDPEDHEIGSSSDLRAHRIQRLTEEAREQGGLLSQEDLAQILGAHIRTVRHDINKLRKLGIHVATRGQQKDIGPGISHRGQAIRHWLEGKEPVEVARAINHSLHATERYIHTFARVVFCAGKGLEHLQTAFIVGISTAAVNTFIGIFEEFKNSSGFRHRAEELHRIGEAHYEVCGQKRGILSARTTSNPALSKP
jgi:biotin operon repressor